MGVDCRTTRGFHSLAEGIFNCDPFWAFWTQTRRLGARSALSMDRQAKTTSVTMTSQGGKKLVSFGPETHGKPLGLAWTHKKTTGAIQLSGVKPGSKHRLWQRLPRYILPLYCASSLTVQRLSYAATYLFDLMVAVQALLPARWSAPKS